MQTKASDPKLRHSSTELASDVKDRIEQLSVDRSAKPIAILSPAIKTGASLLAALCVGTGLWATLAKIPVRVNGIAVLVSSEGFFQVTSPSTGRVIYPFQTMANGVDVAIVSAPWAARAHKMLYAAEAFNKQQVEQLAREIVNSDLDHNFPRFDKASLSGGAGTGGNNAVHIKRNQLVAIIDNPNQRAEINSALIQLQIQKRTNGQLQQMLRQNLRDSNQYSASREAQLSRTNKAYLQGALSATDQLNQTAELYRSRQSISELRTQILEADRRIGEEHEKLFRSLTAFLSSSLVFAKDDADISQVMLNQNSEVTGGQVLMTLQWRREIAADKIPVFMSQQSIAQIRPGMSTISTPLGFSSAEIGGINGTITELDPLPVSAAEIAARVGSAGIAQLVTQSGGLYQANMHLTRNQLNNLNNLQSAYRSNYGTNQNRGGYQWNNRSGPPIPPREGFLLATQITTRYRTPLEMLLPSIREVLGLNAPDKLLRQSLNQN